MDELARVNRITDTATVEVGQQIFIPNRVTPAPQSVKYSESEDFMPPADEITGVLSLSSVFTDGFTKNPVVNKCLIALS